MCGPTFHIVIKAFNQIQCAYHLYCRFVVGSISSTALPLDGLLLLLDHVCQLLEYRAQLHDGALNVLHCVCTVLDVRSL